MPTSSLAMAWVAPDARISMPAQHLVLHFDINETILVEDEAGGDSRQDCFNKMLAKSAFVRIIPASAEGDDEFDLASTHTCVPTHWWNGRPLDEQQQPLDQHETGTSAAALPAPPPLYTDWEWPKGCCPYYRTAYKKRSKTFVQHHGSIYRSVYNQLRAAFPGTEETDNDPDDSIVSHILPAFFHTLRHLPEDCTKTIVLRTFGSDLVDIANAVSEFAQGKHPDHADFRNEALVFSDDALVQGRWAVALGEDATNTRQTKLDSSDDYDDDGNAGNAAEPPDFVYQLWSNKNNQLVASGDAQVLQFLHSHTICGIQDDYDHWRKHNHEPWAGKPVWIPNDPKYHHIMFDDNM